MKRISKLTHSLGLLLPAAIVAMGLALPTAAFAVVSTPNATVDRAQSPICTNLSADSDKVTAGISAQTDKLTAARDQQDQKMTANRTKEDATIAAARQTVDARRQDNFTKLEAKATTDEQKVAVQEYETSITNAINGRRLTYNAARNTFRSGVDDAISAQRSQIDDDVSTLKTAVQAAVAAAQDSCNNDSSVKGGAAIRATFVASLKSARQAFKARRQQDTRLKSTISKLAQTRNQSFKAADASFKASTRILHDTLKTAFGDKAPSIE